MSSAAFFSPIFLIGGFGIVFVMFHVVRRVCAPAAHDEDPVEVLPPGVAGPDGDGLRVAVEPASPVTGLIIGGSSSYSRRPSARGGESMVIPVVVGETVVEGPSYDNPYKEDDIKGPQDEQGSPIFGGQAAYNSPLLATQLVAISPTHQTILRMPSGGSRCRSPEVEHISS